MASAKHSIKQDKIKSFFPKPSQLVLALIFLLPASPSLANWSLNIGYHNPPQAGLGVNFLYDWTQFALELGIGNIRTDANFNNDSKTQGDNGVGLGFGGDINGKFLFMQGPVRPYLQLGTLLGTYGSVGRSSGLGLGSGGIFFGGGLWIGQTSSIHGYLSYNLINSSSFLQAGLGFDI